MAEDNRLNSEEARSALSAISIALLVLGALIWVIATFIFVQNYNGYDYSEETAFISMTWASIGTSLISWGVLGTFLWLAALMIVGHRSPPNGG